ncbi:hypothetical protein [Salinispira pacifica]|uniref:IPT/TIG domain-containing protein n=1 Tax=Salinispira pacifica TaxID=1307761 RepID=V5WEZ6_9SPIO|nr:hypothetical protein [Salinispira pacifica]AHC14205.1 hypothetical protein L21SP2_0783 [Salinispira pacifica]
MKSSRKKLLVFSGIAAVLILFAVNLFFFLRKPHLVSIDPYQARSGDIVVLSGRFLGRPDPGNSLNVGGQRITSSYILEWERDRISFRIPEGLSSGDVIVELPQGRSNPLLFTNVDSIPVPADSRDEPELQAALAEEADESLWLVSVRGIDFGELRSARWFWDDTPLPRSRIVFIREGEEESRFPSAGQNARTEAHVVGIHLPVYEYFPSFLPEDEDGEGVSTQEIRRSLMEIQNEVSRRLSFALDSRFSSAREGQPGGETQPDNSVSLFQIRKGNSLWENLLYSRRENLPDNSSGDDIPLYSLSLSIDIPQPTANESPSGHQPGAPEYILTLPLPEITNPGYELRGNFRGYLQALPSPEQIPAFRLLPGSMSERRNEGNLTLQVYGRPLQPAAPPPGLLYGSDDFSQAGVFRPVYEDYLAVSGQPLLDPDLRQELQASIAARQGALPLARGMYEWISLQDISGIEGIGIFIDELRRLGIPARERWGYVRRPEASGEIDPGEGFNSSTQRPGRDAAAVGPGRASASDAPVRSGGFSVTSWAEFFLPRWGWVPVYRESLENDAPFASTAAEYLPVPLDQPFPRLETINPGKAPARLATRLIDRH